MPSRLGIVASLVALAACGGPSTLTMTNGPRGRLIEAPVPVRHATSAPPAPEPPLPGRPFADSPITAFAEQLTDFVLAALEGRSLPPLPIETRAPIDAPEIEWRSRRGPRPRRLDVLAVAIEVELVLKRGEPDPDAAGPDRWGAVRATIAITRHGLRVVSLQPRAMSPDPLGGALPSGLAGLADVSRRLLSDLRRGDVSAYALNEADRRLLANDAVWTQLHEDGPPLRRAGQIARMLEGLPDEPLAYWLDDVGILARDEEGRLYALTLELDPRGSTFVLSTSPLIEVRRLWPE